MRLRNSEIVLRVIKRHRTPFLFNLAKILLIAAPLYALIIFIAKEFDAEVTLFLLALISFFVGIIIAVISLDYLLDKLIITNKRVIWINWRSLFKKEEHEAELLDIQDIESREKGILSKLKIFDYGFLEIETASSKVCISFNDCPDPDSVKHFLLAQMEKQRGGVREKEEKPGPNEDWSVN